MLKAELSQKYRMIAKVHKTKDNKMMLVVCDKDLIGRKFTDGEKQLDLTSDFYKGTEKTKAEISDLMRNCSMLNLVGENTLKIAVDEELISSKNVLRISDIPYAQINVDD